MEAFSSAPGLPSPRAVSPNRTCRLPPAASGAPAVHARCAGAGAITTEAVSTAPQSRAGAQGCLQLPGQAAEQRGVCMFDVLRGSFRVGRLTRVYEPGDHEIRAINGERQGSRGGRSARRRRRSDLGPGEHLRMARPSHPCL